MFHHTVDVSRGGGSVTVWRSVVQSCRIGLRLGSSSTGLGSGDGSGVPLQTAEKSSQTPQKGPWRWDGPRRSDSSSLPYLLVGSTPIIHPSPPFLRGVTVRTPLLRRDRGSFPQTETATKDSPSFSSLLKGLRSVPLLTRGGRPTVPEPQKTMGSDSLWTTGPLEPSVSTDESRW